MTHKSPGAFCAEVRGPLVGALTVWCGDRWLAEELAQEALARAFQRWSVIEQPIPWTYAVAFNLGRSTFRRRAAERRARDRSRQMAVDTAAEPDTATAVAVRAAVAALAPRQREVVACRFYAQMDVAETARVMRCAQGTVKALTSQAIGALRRAGLDVDDPAPPTATQLDDTTAEEVATDA